MIDNSEGNKLVDFVKLVLKDNSGSGPDIAPAIVEENMRVSAVKKKGSLRDARLFDLQLQRLWGFGHGSLRRSFLSVTLPLTQIGRC